MKRLEGKIALITGGSLGIGTETARLFAKEGATVIVVDILDELGKKFVETLGDKAHYFHLDVSKEQDWLQVIAKVKNKFGRLDVLFNNAGISGLAQNLGPQDPENTSLASWHHVHAVNLDSVFLGCKYAIELMKKHGGSIINMSSRSGMVGIPAAAAYASSKAAIRNHTKTVALYCAGKGYKIRCNSLHPGPILTSIWNLDDDPKAQAKMIEEVSKGVPLGFMGKPLDVAYLALYLASNESEYMTGSELTLDGGILAGSSSTLPKKE